MSIAVAHDPPRITLHSIQDGQEEHVLPVVTPSNTPRRSFRITGVWWFQEEQNVITSSIPDMFRRNNTIVRASNCRQSWEVFRFDMIILRQGRPIQSLRPYHCSTIYMRMAKSLLPPISLLFKARKRVQDRNHPSQS